MPILSRALLLACCLVVAGPGAPGARDLGARMVTEDEAPTYHAIGRLNVAGNRYCTATLISQSLVLTAAHCLFNPLTGRKAQPADMRFVAGQRGESHVALRGIRALVTQPGYVFHRLPGGTDARTDLALLQLDAPISADLASPLGVGSWDRTGAVSMVSYGRDRAYIPSVRDGCQARRRSQAVVQLDCPAVPGVSGAPVLREGVRGPVVVGVVSALMKGDPRAVAVTVSPEMIEALTSLLLGEKI